MGFLPLDMVCFALNPMPGLTLDLTVHTSTPSSVDVVAARVIFDPLLGDQLVPPVGVDTRKCRASFIAVQVAEALYWSCFSIWRVCPRLWRRGLVV